MSLLKKKTIKKAISTFTAITTMVWLSGISMLAVSSVAVADDRPSVVVSGVTVYDGDTISSNETNSDGTPTLAALDVYITKVVGTKKFKRLVLNPEVFNSYGHLSWGAVREVNKAVVDGFTTASLVRVDGDAAEKVYALAPSGDTGSKSWVNLTAAQFTGVSGTDADSVYTINSTDAGNYTAVTDVTTTTQLSTFYTSGTLPGGAVPAGEISAALSATTPASSTLIVNQANAYLADFVLTGSGTVTGVTLKRVGVSQDSTLSNVYLFDGATRLTDAASVSSGNVNFANASGLFTVSGSKTISVKAELAGTAGETVGVQLTGVTLASGSVTGLPISANMHSIASATLAGVAVGTPLPSSAATTDPASNVRIWESTFTVTTRDVNLSRLALRQINSIESKDINNFVLLIDGVQVGSAVQALDANGYVTFSGFTKLLTSGNRNVKVMADVIGGSSRIIQMSLRNRADIDVTDSQYGVSIAVSGTIPASTSTLTVNSGSVTIEKASDSPSGNVTDASSNVKVAKYNFKAYGEPIKVETLTIGFDVSGTDADQTLRNVRVLVNGSQVGSTTSVPAAASHASGTLFTTNFVVNPGTTSLVEIYTDIYDNEGANDITTGSTIQAGILAGSSNASRQISLGTVNVPSSLTVANQVTVAAGAMTLASLSSYPNQTTVVPRTAYKLGAWSLTGSSTEAINIHTFSLDIDEVTGTTFNESDLNDMYLVYGGTTSTIKSTASAADNDWSVNYTLAKNGSITIELYANIGSSITAAHSVKTDLTATGTGADSGTTVSQADKDGQTITYQAGSITATRDAGTPDAVILDDSGTVKTASYKFASLYDDYTITEVVVAITNASTVANVILKNGSTVLATKPGATAVTFSGLSVSVLNNQSKVIDVYVELSPVGVGAGTSGSAVTTDYTSAKAIAGSTGIESTVTDSTSAGNAMYVYKAIPTIINQTLPTGVLGTGTQTLAKFKIASSGGTIGWKKLMFTITKTGGVAGDPALTSGTLWDASTNTQIAGTATHTTTGETDTSGSIAFVATSEQQIDGEKTYVLKTTVAGTLASGDNVNTSIAQPSSYIAPAAYATVAATTASFAWTDVSASSHDETTLDWNNGFLVKNLPTDSQTLTK